ncbi:MAG: hypothetical protein R3B60_04300 [Candidatus Paceibacterota bacterium]
MSNKKYTYDMHVATENDDGSVVGTALKKIGFVDDNLVDRRIIMNEDTQRFYTACPLIAVHVSKKVDDIIELRRLESLVDGIMLETNSVGYWHSECILSDVHITPSRIFKLKYFPFQKLRSKLNEENKVWDIHISVPRNSISDEIVDFFVENGIYFLARKKSTVNGLEEHAVFTVQGINGIEEGKRLFNSLCDWVRETNFPSCDIKLELTTGMKKYNSPLNIPPTISFIDWR